MTSFLLIAADLVAITAMTALFYTRHKRRDLLVAFLVTNIGVLALAAIFAGAEVGLGVGLGLFGVLSIIRLRSTEISQHEVAYYFASLAMGLILGLATSQPYVQLMLAALIFVALFIGDHPALAPRTRRLELRLDHAYPTEAAATVALEELLDAEILRVRIQSLDLVNDSTQVEVRYRTGTARRHGLPTAQAPLEQEAALR